MSMHTATMLTRWAVTADEKYNILLDDLAKIKAGERKTNDRLISLVRFLYKKWSEGLKIERLATFGWKEEEVCKMFDELLSILPQLRKQYLDAVKIHGLPPELADKDLEKYEKTVEIVSKELKEIEK